MTGAKSKKKPAPKTRKVGRPSLYTEALAAEICRRLAEGESLRAICTDKAMPAISTVMGWLFDGKHDDFSAQYARAREAQAELRADEITDIADGVEHGASEAVQAARLRVDARKWIAAKLLPKRYGDKLDLGGTVGLRWEDALKELEE
jgi:hypothetical protein